MSIKIFSIAALVVCLNVLSVAAQDMRPTSSLVYPGVDGQLVYIADSLGNKIPDFSNAGYKSGGVAIPQVQIKAIVWPVPGDNSDHLQKVIDSVSSLPPDVSGFRGTVLLKMGEYNLEKTPLHKSVRCGIAGRGNE